MLTVLIIGLLTSSTLMASAKSEASQSEELEAVRRATVRYHSVAQAERDGYIRITGCVASPAGAMGIHLANADLMNDGVLDPERPEILLYMPKGKGLRLVGVEYWLRDSDQDLGTNDDLPSLFGQPFNGPMAGHIPGMPVHFDLHVWTWEANPAGVFEPYNSSLRCPQPDLPRQGEAR
jgi:hypothetical protein